jgi:hypothetical protein
MAKDYVRDRGDAIADAKPDDRERDGRLTNGGA